MVSNLLIIVESSHEIQIDEEKLKFICSKVNICDHFKITKSKYVSLNYNEKMLMFKRFYHDLLPVYTSQGKLLVCCKYCVFVDNGTKQNCLKCKVNVIHCICSLYDDRKFFYLVKNNKIICLVSWRIPIKRRKRFLIQS